MNIEPALIICCYLALFAVALKDWKPRYKPAIYEPVSDEITGYILTPHYRANRNDPCPCGSGRKFKVCHG